MTIETQLAKPAVPALVELFILDMTRFNEGYLRFTPHTQGGTANVVFGGHTYFPMPIHSEGWAAGIGGAPPRPVLKVSNITRFIQPYLIQYNDLVGVPLTRKLTLDIFLAGGATPDPTQVLAEQRFVIQQKRRLNKLEVEFILSSLLDAPNFKLPKGVVLRREFPAAGLWRKS